MLKIYKNIFKKTDLFCYRICTQKVKGIAICKMESLTVRHNPKAIISYNVGYIRAGHHLILHQGYTRMQTLPGNLCCPGRKGQFGVNEVLSIVPTFWLAFCPLPLIAHPAWFRISGPDRTSSYYGMLSHKVSCR